MIQALAGDDRQLVATAPVRGQSTGSVLVRQQLGDREFATHVDAREADRFLVMLDFGVDATARGTRVSLFKDEREVSSEYLRQGRVLLPELSAGRWYLEVRDPDGGSAALTSYWRHAQHSAGGMEWSRVPALGTTHRSDGVVRSVTCVRIPVMVNTQIGDGDRSEATLGSLCFGRIFLPSGGPL